MILRVFKALKFKAWKSEAFLCFRKVFAFGRKKDEFLIDFWNHFHFVFELASQLFELAI